MTPISSVETRFEILCECERLSHQLGVTHEIISMCSKDDNDEQRSLLTEAIESIYCRMPLEFDNILLACLSILQRII